MQVLSLLKPIHKRWVALFFLLCWVVPLLGVMGFSIFSPAQAFNRLETAEKVPEEKLLVGADRPAEEGPTVERTVENKIDTVPTTEQAAPPVQQRNALPSTAQTSAVASGRKNDPIDLNLLARVIYAEARGEPFEGQVAVGAVLINRVRSPKFPNDLWSVVFKKGEFCTVRDGQVWMEPNATAYRAARLAKSGWDPTNGALYFYNPSKTASKWIWSRKVTTRIGSHLFAV